MFLDGLSTRGLNIVVAFNYKSKDSVKKDIEAGIFSERNMKNLGQRTFREICIWCEAYPPNAVSPMVQKAISLLIAHGYRITK